MNRSATLMFVLSNARIGLSTWLNEQNHDTLYNGLLAGPTKMVTGAFKGAQWKTIIIILHSLHARAACQQAIINARGGSLCEEQGIHGCT